MVPQKLAFSGKRGRFRAKSQEIKVVGNAILQTFHSMIFFLRVVGNAILKAVYSITFF